MLPSLTPALSVVRQWSIPWSFRVNDPILAGISHDVVQALTMSCRNDYSRHLFGSFRHGVSFILFPRISTSRKIMKIFTSPFLNLHSRRKKQAKRNSGVDEVPTRMPMDKKSR
jgi:hypothetical protein